MMLRNSVHEPAKAAETPAWLVPNRRLRLLRAGMRILGAIRPALAGRVMDRLWFSAPRSTPRVTERAILDTGEPLSFDVHGRSVAAWTWGNEGPTVLLLHGWGGNAGQMHAFVAPLRRAGFRVIAFDAPAHGASAPSRLGGRRVTFFEFAEALQIVASGEPALAGIIAHSGGCTAVALALRQGWTAPAMMVFVSPFARPAAAIDDFARAIGANRQVTAAFRAGVERWFQRPWSYLDVSTLADSHKWRRLLVVHDEEDREVPLSHACAVADSWPSAQLMVTRGLGHRRPLRDADVVERVLAFLADGPGASSAEAGGYLPRDSRSGLDAAYEALVSDGAGTFAPRRGC